MISLQKGHAAILKRPQRPPMFGLYRITESLSARFAANGSLPTARNVGIAELTLMQTKEEMADEKWRLIL